MTIEEIDLSGITPYGNNEIEKGFKEVNYFFGYNGTGKTTITRVIANSPSSLKWQNGQELKKLVYNQDFIKINFESSIPGIFTLGQQQVELLEKIKKLNDDIIEIKKEITGFQNTLSNDTNGFEKQLKELEEKYGNKFWECEKQYKGVFKDTFKGFMGSIEDFKKKVLLEAKENISSLRTYEELKQESENLFSQTPVKFDKYQIPNFDDIINLEKNTILDKSIIGKTDVDISAMIKRLKNIDWVRQGKTYLEINDNVCPFCQQKINDSFKKSLDDFFDEQYEIDLAKISSLHNDYNEDIKIFKEKLKTISDNPTRFIESDKLNTSIQCLEKAMNYNLSIIEKKEKEPSQKLTMNTILDSVEELKKIIESANSKIDQNNVLVENYKDSSKKLKSEIWKFIIQNLDLDIKEYNKRKDGIQKGVETLTVKIKDKEKLQKDKENEKKDLERQTTSIVPTITAINSLLLSFGFNNFYLAEAGDNKYKIVRENGNDVKDTLSEGERNFITFLYFYCLIDGSQSDSGTKEEEIVVIDDPVSSLDSNVLYVVCSLIQNVINQIKLEHECKKSYHVKQLFILTHNVFFHKDLTYMGNRSENKPFSYETFWLLRKNDNHTVIELKDKNPVQTSYQLLWNELKESPSNKLTIPNTMRRILEYYFKMLGSKDLNALCNEFDGNERIICKSLAAWVNFGSHDIGDDAFVSISDDQIKIYLEVFKKIFEKTNHIEHYNMMMGIVNNP